MIETINLTKHFGNIKAVQDLNMSIEQGDIFGFIGPNGAGKTTTLLMLSTLLKPTSGSANICNYCIRRNPDDVRKHIGFMPDSFGVYSDIKVWEYLDFFASSYKINITKRKKIIDDVLELTDLQMKRDSFVEELSRGMRQRLCLAKTLLHNPDVLLLDEPASGLDPRARIELRELLKELRKMGKTILISSHILTELSDFCNKIGIIEQGNLLASGEVSVIIEKMKGEKFVYLTIESEPERAVDLLKSQDYVISVERDDHSIEVECSYKLENIAPILELLILNGLRITAVKEETLDLEDIFMEITKGAVQ
jgi:ABC-2 type transport system ATP-binding protein